MYYQQSFVICCSHFKWLRVLTNGTQVFQVTPEIMKTWGLWLHRCLSLVASLYSQFALEFSGKWKVCPVRKVSHKLAWAQNGNATNDHVVVHLQSSFWDMLSVLRNSNIWLSSFFPSQVCDSLGGDDTVGAGLHRSHDGGDPCRHAAAAEGILHVPQPGRGIRGHRSAGWHCPQAAAGQRRPGAGPSPAAARTHHQEVSAGSGVCCQHELTARSFNFLFQSTF